jgi:hypothetical protein
MEKNAGCRAKAGIATLHSAGAGWGNLPASGNGRVGRQVGKEKPHDNTRHGHRGNPPQAARIDPRKGAEGSGFFERRSGKKTSRRVSGRLDTTKRPAPPLRAYED